ncbi:MAG: hypothetical protein IJH99_05360 [Eubacterium sp.]|nr:hypothetical protein [Eubacterium sp.]
MDFNDDNKTKGRMVFDRLSEDAQKFFLASDALSVWEYGDGEEKKYAFRMRGCHIESDLTLSELDKAFSELSSET